MLIFLACITNNVSAQFVPFQSGHFKRLAADTLYDFTGCDTPTVTPNSYRRVVRYYDSCNHLNWHWQPELQEWAVSGGGGAGGGDSTLFALSGTRIAQGDVTGDLDGNQLITQNGNIAYVLPSANTFRVLNNASEWLSISPPDKNAYIRAINSDSGFSSQFLATAYDAFPGFSATTNQNGDQSYVSVEGSLKHGLTHFVAKDGTGDTLTQTDMYLYAKQNDPFRAAGFEILSQQGDPYIHVIGNTLAQTITFDADNVFPRNGNPGSGKVPTGSDGLGNWTWQDGGSRDTAYLIQGYGTLINNIEGIYKPNGADVLIAVDTSLIATKTDITIITNSDTAVFIVDSIANTPTGSEPNGTKYLVGTSPTGVFATHANDIAELIGGTWTFTDPVAQQQLIVDNAVTYATYQFNGTIWVQTSVLWRVGGNRAIGQNAFLGRVDKAPVTVRAWNRQVIRFDTTRDVKFYKFIGTRPGNYAFFDSTTGNIDTGFFRPLIAGTNIAITPGPVGDTISSTGGGSTLAAQVGYTLHGTGTGVYEDTIIYKDTANAWVAINRTIPASVLDVYPTFPGTVTTTNGSTTITGTNTRFISNFKPGDSIYVAGTTVGFVLSVESNTSLTLWAGYTGSTASAQAYSNLSTIRGVFRLVENGNIQMYGVPFIKNNLGYKNVGIGPSTLTNITWGQNNTAIGYQSLQGNTSGGNNSAIGYQSLRDNTGGEFNTAIGYAALRENTNGILNTAVGVGALSVNYSHRNTAIGVNALVGNTVGLENTAIGTNTLYQNQSGNNNIAIGYGSLYYLNGRDGNIAIGDEAGTYLTDLNTPNTASVKSIFIGFKTSTLGASDTNAIVIGSDLTSKGSNTVAIGNTATTDTWLGGTTKLHITLGTAPASATATGVAGTVIVTTDYIYVCTATDTWKRTAISTW